MNSPKISCCELSNVTDGSIKYEPSIVRALFLHVLETGLQNEAVRAKFRLLLEAASVTDEPRLENELTRSCPALIMLSDYVGSGWACISGGCPAFVERATIAITHYWICRNF